ncbi:hypothetical protein L2729_07060 [Shewanella gelidimarina]|uniref:multiheme c-type cytochrome n=1 Tax=Shewanella gelidimarina TaxID=56813 RepID=UPI00200EF2A4|nr:cytochrome c3 family protein [Shewanella gelidimarina]MCL1057760.1 hypothetical protein [Shewanella gelidimarina]
MNRVFTQPLVYTAVMMSLLSGCSDGDDGKPGLDGKQGQDGKPGNPGLIIATSAEQLSLKYLDASINDDGASTAKFEVLNELDLPVVGINSVSFIKAQLLNNPKGFSEFQYLSDLDCTTATDSCLTDHGDGSYTVTDSKQQSQYDKSVPQRFVLSLSKHNGNTIYSENLIPEIAKTIDFMVDGSELTSTRKIVTTASCNECHTDLAFAKNGYEGESHYTNDINGCITCHADGNDINGAKGEQLSSITGFAHEWHNTLHGEKVRIAYDCTSCHATENTAELPNASDWLSDTANDKACLSCHPAESLKHNANLALNCSACHSVEQIHTKTSKVKKVTLDTNADQLVNI